MSLIIKSDLICRLLSWVFPIQAITLWPFIICRKNTTKRTLDHERIHLAQQKELLLIGFYLLYLFYWLRNLGRGGEASYDAIPFEKEARCNEDNHNYLKTRKCFAWREQ